MNEIISKGTIEKRHLGFNIRLGDFVVGIKQGFDKADKNKQVVTSFDTTKNKQGTISNAHLDSIRKDRLSSLNLANENNIPQNTLSNNKMKGGFTTQAMAKNIVAGGVGGGIGAYSAPSDKKLEGFTIGAWSYLLIFYAVIITISVILKNK